MKALFNCADDIAVVLRAHFMIERVAILKVEKIAPSFLRVIDRPKLSHAINVLRFLDAPDQFWRPLKELDKIRHRFAHEGTDVILRSDIDALLKVSRPQIQARIIDGNIGVVKNNLDNTYKYDDAPVRVLFSMVVATIFVEITGLCCSIYISHTPFGTQRKIQWEGLNY